MGFAFLLKKFITQLILPPFNLLLLAIVGVLVMRRWPRIGRALVLGPLLLILFLATPAVAGWLIHSLDVAPTFVPQTAKPAQAIVILGGGLRANTPEYGDTPSHFTLDRIRYGATIAKQTQLPVLVSGGAVSAETPEAEAMAATLQNEFGVAVRWKEIRSLDTEDNFKFSAAILSAAGIRTVILVTHDFHMRRSLAHCEAAGLICIPAPVSLTGRSSREVSGFLKLPNAGALETSALALHEMFGYLALQLK